MDELKALVFQALGQASMCWSEGPKGTFDSAQAKNIGDELITAIKQYNQKSIEDAYASWHLSNPTIIRDTNGKIIAQSRNL
jgi:hypothetical protein